MENFTGYFLRMVQWLASLTAPMTYATCTTNPPGGKQRVGCTRFAISPIDGLCSWCGCLQQRPWVVLTGKRKERVASLAEKGPSRFSAPGTVDQMHF
ncbi:hypothetical protein B0I35DRAFT_438262 [Stachybotrys elegans]|uniref:Secreted protein n=1 Tax=Stachybotrys elegans TaxID=80388 RepID=A0A8K0SLG7_9HYPO|nr:hypothetical protein B0I35DRAFT_438262 [Stachybotrys elegans]